MKYRFLFFMFFVFTCVSAQTIDSVAVKQVDSLIQVSRALTDIGDYEQALKVNATAEKLSNDKLGKDSESYAMCCFNKGIVNTSKQDVQEAEKWYLEAIAIQKLIIGKEHPDYATSVINLAFLYSDHGLYEKAEPLYLELKSIKGEVYGKEHPEYAHSLNNLGLHYLDIGDYEKAESLYIESKVIRENVLGKNHRDYAASLCNLAILNYYLGNYEKALLLYLEAKDIQEQVLGKEHPQYASTLNNLAVLYLDMGNYEQAEPLHLEDKAIQEKILGKEHPDYAQSLNNLANLYKYMGNFEKAEPLYLEAKAIRIKVLGMEHPSYAGSLNNLAAFYHDIGNYKEAELFYLESLTINEKTLGKEHPRYLGSLNNLAVLYLDMGNYEKAEPLYLEEKSITEKVLGKEHPDYAVSLNNLANFYSDIGEYDKVEMLYLESINICIKVLGKDHPTYALRLANLALHYLDMGNHEKAEPLCIESKTIREKILGKEHPAYAASLNTLALLYTELGNYKIAEPLYLEAKAIREKVLGKENPDYAETINRLANLYERQDRFSASEHLLKEESFLKKELLVKATSFLSEQELAKYINTFQKNGADLNNFLLARLVGSGQIGILPELAFDHALFYKGFLLSSTSKLNSHLTTSPESEEISLRLKGYRRRLASEYAKPIAERKGIAELEERANDAEKELARSVVGYAAASRQVNWLEVQATLPDSAAALEFVHFPVTYPSKTDSVQYAVLILRPGSKQPQFIPLFEENNLERLLESRQQRKSDYVNNLYTWAERDTISQTGSGTSLKKLGGQKQSLYELIWEKIEDAGLNDIKTIYYSPSGILHRINMGAISVGENQLLSNRYQLVAINSTRQIVTGKSDELFKGGGDALVYGGIQFEADTTEIIPLEESDFPLLATRSLAAVAEDSTLRGGSWQYLHWTQKEAEVISTTLSKGGLKADHRSGIYATEERFKAMGQSNSPSPRVLHIATHGFFFPDPEQKTATSLDDQSVFKWSDNPMIRSGLILAGGNYAWKNGKPVSPEKEDGILTAYEISQMNLSNTELVVLSACETGLGDIQGNEGVYGLQRAFKIAGAKYLIMSLWQVPDRETMEFMTAFYKNWLPSDAEALAGKEGKMTIPDAFRKTQREMRDRFINPYSWAAFVLVE